MDTSLPITPCRLPDWRWREGFDRVEHPQRCIRRSSDRAVEVVARFWDRLKKASTPQQKDLLVEEMPIMSQAFTLTRVEHETVRHTIEARVLAREDTASIAKKSVIKPAVIDCYVDVFFDVRESLDSPDYLFNQVFRKCASSASGAAADFQAVKMLGYLGGVQVLDAVLLPRGASVRPDDGGEVEAFMTDVTRASVRRRLTNMMLTMGPSGPQVAAGLMRVVATRMSQADTGEGLAAQQMLMECIHAAVKESPWAIGNDSPDTPIDVAEQDHNAAARARGRAVIAEMDQSAAELRDHELMRLHHGLPVAGLDEWKKIKSLDDLRPPESKPSAKRKPH